MKARAVLVAVCVVLSMPPAAHGFTFGIELAPGVGIPVSNFIDGFPIDADLSAEMGQYFSNVALRFDLSNKPGFMGALFFLLEDFEIGYQPLVLPFHRATLTHIMFKDITDKYYVPVEVLQDAGLIGTGDLSVDISGDLKPAVFHAFTFGYRFNLTDTAFRPYIPCAIGFALGRLEGDNLPGFILQMGLGAEYRFHGHWAAGACVRYNWVAVQNPRTLGSSVKELGIDQAAANQTLLGAAIESVQVVSVLATASYRF